MKSRQRSIGFALCALSYFIGGIQFSIIAPFFPELAERKGISSTQYGLVFAIFEFVILVCSPIVGSWIAVWNPKPTLVLGLTITAVGSCLFGMLEKIVNPLAFFLVGLLTRSFEAMGVAAYTVSIATIVSMLFPENAATALTSLDVMIGFGVFVGPLLGGYLYQVGGYSFPFIINGFALLLTGFAVWIIMPGISGNTAPDNYKAGEGLMTDKTTLKSVLRIPGNIVTVGSLIVATSATGFLAVALEPHVRHFNMKKWELGSLFVIEGFLMSIVAPIVGVLCDRKMIRPGSALVMGLLFILVSGILIGPAPFIPLDSTIRLIVTSLCFQGVGVGIVYAASFAGLYESARDTTASASKNGIISSIWLTGQAIGFCLGNLVSGLLAEFYTLERSSFYIVISASLLILAVVNRILFKESKRERANSDGCKLLQQDSKLV